MLTKKFYVLFFILFVSINTILTTIYELCIIRVRTTYNIPAKHELFYAVSVLGEYTIILIVSIIIINILIPLKE